MIIEINGLTKAQEIAVSDFFAKIQGCVDNDASRWIALFADGADSWDGVTIQIDGSEPTNCGIPANFNRWWHLYFKHGEDYSPEPFYLAESNSVQEALSANEENQSSKD
jgi:hypothetical protein